MSWSKEKKTPTPTAYCTSCKAGKRAAHGDCCFNCYFNGVTEYSQTRVCRWNRWISLEISLPPLCRVCLALVALAALIFTLEQEGDQLMFRWDGLHLFKVRIRGRLCDRLGLSTLPFISRVAEMGSVHLLCFTQLQTDPAATRFKQTCFNASLEQAGRVCTDAEIS